MAKFVVFILFVLFPTALAAQAKQSFFVDAEDLAHPLTFTALRRSAPHELNLSRRFANDQEERILRIAKAVYPSGEASTGATSKSESGKSREWWCSSFDKVRIPRAITRSAVAYYLDIAESFRANTFWPKMTSSSLTYSAKLALERTLQGRHHRV